jgi:hypothetical protein
VRSSGIKPFLVFFWSIKFTEKIWAEAEVDLVLLSNIKIVRKAGIVTVTEVITLKIGIAELITEEKVITEVITVERVEVGNITEVGEGVDHPHEIGKSKGPEVHISLVIIGHTYVCMYYLQCDIFCIPGTCTCNITTIFRYQKVKK